MSGPVGAQMWKEGHWTLSLQAQVVRALGTERERSLGTAEERWLRKKGMVD